MFNRQKLCREFSGHNINNRQKGTIGEDIAEEYLTSKNFKIVARNFRTRYGEIDLIAVKEKTIWFFEIKARKNFNYGMPEESVNALKLYRIKSTAESFLAQNDRLYDNFEFKFSVIAINLTPPDNLTINEIAVI